MSTTICDLLCVLAAGLHPSGVLPIIQKSRSTIQGSAQASLTTTTTQTSTGITTKPSPTIPPVISTTTTQTSTVTIKPSPSIPPLISVTTVTQTSMVTTKPSLTIAQLISAMPKNNAGSIINPTPFNVNSTPSTNTGRTAITFTNVAFTSTSTGPTLIGSIPTSLSSTPTSSEAPASIQSTAQISSDTSREKSRLSDTSIGIIVGGTVGGYLLLIIVGILYLFFRRKMRNTTQTPTAGSKYPVAFPIILNSTLPHLPNIASFAVPSSNQTINALPKKRVTPGQMGALREEHSNGPTIDLENQTNAISGGVVAITQRSMHVQGSEPELPTVSEEVMLLRALLRAVEERPPLTMALAGDGDNRSIDTADAPPGYEIGESEQ